MFIAIVQILTTLHFSSKYSDVVAVGWRKKTRRGYEYKSTFQHSVSQNTEAVKTTDVFDLRKSKVSA